MSEQSSDGVSNRLLDLAIRAAKAACVEIMSVYHSENFQVQIKGDDSPLTVADKRANAAIVKILKDAALPILSEEGKQTPFEERAKWQLFWLVDPLDGTKEFINRNGEFTVNIALISGTSPILGVVAIPVTGDIFYTTAEGVMLETNGQSRLLQRRKPVDLTTSRLRVVASRSHMNADTDQFISKLDQPILVSKGSSLKFLLLAEGKADIYPRFGPTMEWDTAAAHAIVNAAGLKVIKAGTDRELEYNKEDLLNPSFVVC